MSVIIDSSVALNWVMPDEDSTYTETLLDSVTLEGAVVPPLFLIEVGNSLLMGVRRKRISAGYIDTALDLIGRLPLRLDAHGAEHAWTTSIKMAALHDLSLYDATYLELALRLDLPLATLDTKLGRAAERVGVASPWPQPRN